MRSLRARNDGLASLAEQWALTKKESRLGWYILRQRRLGDNVAQIIGLV
jgi:hypothetical protein